MKRLLTFCFLLFWIFSCKGNEVTPPGESSDPHISHDPSEVVEPSGEVSSDPSGDESSDPSESPEPEVFPAITGSFIQYWYPKAWNQSKWDSEMKILSEAGITMLIFTPMVDGNADSFDIAPLQRCLRSAKEYGIQIFVGTNFDSGWWNITNGSDWLNPRMENGVNIARTIYDQLHADYPETLAGWYWDWEIDNISWIARKKVLADAWNITLDGLSEIDPSMPLLFSPFMNPSLGTAKGYGNFWKDVFAMTRFRPGDIFCPQDGTGARLTPPETVVPWLEEMKEAAGTVEGMRFWVNVELFDQYDLSGGTNFATAGLRRVLEQMECAAPYAERLICFAYSHYFSPLQVGESYHEAFVNMVKDKGLPDTQKVYPVGPVTRSQDSGVTLQWSYTERSGVEGVAIFKNDALHVKLQVRQNVWPSSFNDPKGRSSDKYEIATYNCYGDISAKVTF